MNGKAVIIPCIFLINHHTILPLAWWVLPMTPSQYLLPSKKINSSNTSKTAVINTLVPSNTDQMPTSNLIVLNNNGAFETSTKSSPLSHSSSVLCLVLVKQSLSAGVVVCHPHYQRTLYQGQGGTIESV